jgi:hypothetical protein
VLLLILYWLFLFNSQAGDGEKPVTVGVSHNFFNTDNLGNIYLVREAELQKFNAQGKKMGRYSNLKLGDITSVDAMNPLKILLYYRDYQELVFLDNQLSTNGKTIPLEAINLEQASMVCASANNGFWVYDKRNNELVRFDETARKITNTGNLKQILSDEVVPTAMREYNSYLYLNCPGSGIYVFDVYGAFTKLLPIKNISRFQPEGDIVFYFRNGFMCSYDQRLLEEKCDSIFVPGLLSAGVRAHKLYRSFGDSLTVTPLK